MTKCIETAILFGTLFSLAGQGRGFGMTMSLSTPPTLGIGAILFRPKGMTVQPSLGDDELLVEAGKFFTVAFWTSKISGDATELTSAQVFSLERQQIQEFRRRYTPPRNYVPADKTSELLVCKNAKNELMGCAGIEIDTINKPSGTSLSKPEIRAPLMSNLAVGKSFRRRGVAEELVQKAEDIARKEWGYDECYLYVEQKNTPAVKLYQKLGYKKIWKDSKAKTMVPTSGGKLRSESTVIVCMRKRFRFELFDKFLPF